MGQVYRARDTKLNRDVALKVLPDSFANDLDRLARFTREAQTLAALNHPNIAGIYGLEESEGVSALVMELVEGEDLAQRIARGAIPFDEALPIAKQIAEALGAMFFSAEFFRANVHLSEGNRTYDVAPDGRFLMWTRGDATGNGSLKAQPAHGVSPPSGGIVQRDERGHQGGGRWRARPSGPDRHLRLGARVSGGAGRRAGRAGPDCQR
jgi:Protein kinase domain